MKPAVLIETWNGFLFVLLSAAVLALLIFLLETGKGLMRGSGRTAAKTAFWVLTAVHWVCQILFGFSLLFSHPLAALTGAVIQVLGLVRLMSARGTSRTAERRNQERIRESGFARDLIALVRQERPVRIAVFSDGVVFYRSAYPLTYDSTEIRYDRFAGERDMSGRAEGESLLIPACTRTDPRVSRILTFASYGREDMEDIAKRTLALVILEETEGYWYSEHEHVHEEVTMAATSDHRIRTRLVTDGHTCMLTRGEEEQSAPEAPEEDGERAELRRW